MPTGYTSAVANGSVTTLEQFAMICARAFGALLHMRDFPLDAPIPEQVPAWNEYYVRDLERLHRQLAELHAMLPHEAQRRCQQAHSQRIATWKRLCDKNAITRLRYNQMLERVTMWTPPTSDHQRLKEFMLEQIADSLKWDCDASYLQEITTSPPRWSEWLAEEIDRTTKDIARYKRNINEEALRADKKTRWLQQLRASL